MKSIVLNPNINLFPEPLEAQEYLAAHPRVNIGHLALEQALAVNSNEIKAISNGALTTDPQIVSEVSIATTSDWPRNMDRMQKADMVRIYEIDADLGIVDHDSEADTVAAKPGTEHLIGLSNHLLGVTFDSNVAIGDIIGAHIGRFDIETFAQLQHIRRLLMFMRIGQAGNTGVDLTRLETESFGPKVNRRSIQGLTDRLEERGIVKISRAKGQGVSNRIYPTERLTEARNGLIRTFSTLDMNPDEFVASAPKEREKIKPHFAYLYKRALKKANKPNFVTDQLHDDIVEYLSDKPEGASSDDLYEKFGEGYKHKKAFTSMVGRISSRRTGSAIRFESFKNLAKKTGRSRGRWVSIDTRD